MVIGGLEKTILELRHKEHKAHKVNKVNKDLKAKPAQLVQLVPLAHREKLAQLVRRDLQGRKVYKGQLVHLVLE
jgi:hypothetical protein